MSKKVTILKAPEWPIPAEARSALVGLTLPVTEFPLSTPHNEGEMERFTLWTVDIVDALQRIFPEVAHLMRMETAWHMPGIRCYLRKTDCVVSE